MCGNHNLDVDNQRCSAVRSGTHFTKNLWAHNLMINNDPMTSQLCTCHDSWAVVTCAKLWPHRIIRIKIRAISLFPKFQRWPHKHFVKWFPVILCNVAPICSRQYLPSLHNHGRDWHNDMPGRWQISHWRSGNTYRLYYILAFKFVHRFIHHGWRNSNTKLLSISHKGIMSKTHR